MTDLEYMSVAEALLRTVELGCDALNDDTDADIDNQRVGGMITLTFADRSQVVLNLQKPLHEVWLASREGGYHYQYDGAVWRDTKTGHDFYDDLSAALSLHAGQRLRIQP